MCSLCFQVAEAAGMRAGVEQANSTENYVVPPRFTNPSLAFGVSVEGAASLFPGGSSQQHSVSDGPGVDPSTSQSAALGALAELYAQQPYMLVWKGCKGAVLLRRDVDQHEILQAVLQAALLHEEGVQNAGLQELERSLRTAENLRPAFLSNLEKGGWDVTATNIRSADARLQW